MRVEVKKLVIRNYRVLRDVTFTDLTPLTVLAGPNGSGKSTVFDVFAFLNDCFTKGVRAAWDSRNRIDGIRSKGQAGPVSIEIAYRAPNFDGELRLVNYTLKIGQAGFLPVVEQERMRWSTSPGSGRPRDILNFANGSGTIYDEDRAEYSRERLSSRDLLAVSALGQFESHPRVQLLRDFIQGWYLSYLSADGTRATPTAGPERRLSQSGDNLGNVIQYLQEEEPQRLDEIFRVLGARVPQLESVLPERLADGRLLLRLKDRPFADSVLSRFASDGTLKLLAYLTVFRDPQPPAVIGIEEPENQLHPKLLPILAEEIRGVSARSQVVVTTHSPDFLTAIRPKELWAISRAESDGFARVARASSDPRVMAMLNAGANLGQLWQEGYLPGADPSGVA